MTRTDSLLERSYLWHRQAMPSRTAKQALILARKDVEKGTKRYPYSADYKFGGTRNLSGTYFCDDWPAGWRELGTSGDVCRAEGSRAVDHSGWYTDDLQDQGTLQGFVLQIPARKGVLQYVPGTFHSDWNGVTLYLDDICDDKIDCAVRADRYAEIAAEEERDYQEAWRAGSDAASKTEEVKQIRQTVLAKFAEYRAAANEEGSSAAVRHLLREYLRAFIEESCDQIRELREEIDKLRDDVPSSLMHAFNEGFH